MKARNSTNFWIDVASLVAMIGLAVTGGLVHFVLPAGTGQSHLILGLSRHDFGQLHFYIAVAAIVLLALHVLLHWSWICCVIGEAVGGGTPPRRTQIVWGLALLVGIALLIGGGLWLASSAVQQAASERGGRGGEAPLRQESQRPSRIVAEGPGEDRASPPAADASKPAAPPSGTIRVEDSGAFHEKQEEDCPAGASINGRTSLMEAARICGVGIEEFREQMKLPSNADPGEQLGRLKRRYGLEIHDVRRFACR